MSKIKPNIVRGGRSIDLGNNMFLMQGRPHSRGGIDIGKNLEVEGGEVMQYKPNEVRVFSKEPILNGVSPAQYVLGGANPNDVFNAQEYWKIVNRVSDDGTKYQYGGDDKNMFRKHPISTKEDAPQIEQGKYLSKQYKDYFSSFKDYNDYLTNNKVPKEEKLYADRLADYYFNDSGIYKTYFDLVDSFKSYNDKRKQYEGKYPVPTKGNTYKLKSIVNNKPTNKHLLTIDENILNYVYDEAVRGGVDPKIAIALATNESNLGQARQNNNGELNAFGLYSYWKGTDSVIYPNSKIQDPYNNIIKKGLKNLDDSDIEIMKDLTNKYNYMSSRIHEYEGDNVTADAVKYFLSGKYPGVNVGQERIDAYNKLVMSRFDELMNDNRFKIWYNSKSNKKEISGRIKAKVGTHVVGSGDTISKLAKRYNVDIESILRNNSDIKNPSLIKIGQRINFVYGDSGAQNADNGNREQKELHNIKEVRQREADYDNVTAIQSSKHDSNYAILDKNEQRMFVYDKNSNLLATIPTTTGKSNQDYNTKTYTDKSGRLINYAGNNATPAGITEIESTGIYHGTPSFQRVRVGSDYKGKKGDTIASSIHLRSGVGSGENRSNGCIGVNENGAYILKKYLGVGDKIYTLPQNEGSRFVSRDGNLSFIADNVYGKKRAEKDNYTTINGKRVDKHDWDDYNTTINKTYQPLHIQPKLSNDNKSYNVNKTTFVQELEKSKENIQKELKLSSSEYNTLAMVAMGIAEQESRFGTANSYLVKNALNKLGITGFVKKAKGEKTSPSLGIGQIKYGDDNSEINDIYRRIGVNDNHKNINNEAKAIIGRLYHIYRNQYQGGKKYYDKVGLNQEQALAYLYNGGNLGYIKKLANSGKKLEDMYGRGYTNILNRIVGKTSKINKADYAKKVAKYANENDYYAEYKLGGRINKHVNMDFNYIIGKNNIYKLGGRQKAPLGIDILNSQNLHRNAEVFDGVPAIVVDEQVVRPNLTEQQRLLDEASQIINNSIQASVNRDASILNRINRIEGINGPVTIDGRSGTIRPDGTIDLQNRYTLAGNNRGVGYKSIGERNKLLREAKVKNAVNNIKQGIKDNSSELLSTGINLAGNLAGSLINLNAINKMKYYDIIPLRANKLKTNVNINPQLDTLREQLARFEGDTRNNTSSSKVALARRQSARARTAQAINQLFGTKENLQTELINRDRLNQQQVGNMNVQMRNRWRAGKSQFDNQIRNMRAENAIAGINNAIVAFNGENGYFNTRDKKFNEQANRALYALTAPNAVDAITSKNAEKLINTFVEPRFRKRMRRSLGIED